MTTIIGEEEYFDLSDEDKIKLDPTAITDVSITYTNFRGDSENDEAQDLIIKSVSNGVARYINFKTENFSISDVQELIDIFEDFKRKAGMK
jgi:hypothetical protein